MGGAPMAIEVTEPGVRGLRQRFCVACHHLVNRAIGTRWGQPRCWRENENRGGAHAPLDMGSNANQRSLVRGSDYHLSW